MDLVTLSRLPLEDQVRLKNSAHVAQQLENAWAMRVTEVVQSYTSEVLERLQNFQPIDLPGLEETLVEHFFQVSIKSTTYAMTEAEEHKYIPPGQKSLAKPPAQKIPKSLKKLMELYDLWRRKKYVPPRARKQAKDIKKRYLQEVKSVWEKHSRDFREGFTGTQELVRKKIQDVADTTSRRAANIVRTETTSYYNQARKQYYDLSPDITHYLFIAIRDATTSPWCTPLTINGYRGRSGLVYAKTDPLCAKERPACHPGCRSEYLPLNRLNPAHLKYIQDLSIQRRQHTCYPLLKGWGAA